MTKQPPVVDEEHRRLSQLGRAVVETEARAVTGLLASIGEDFVSACQYLLSCKGRIVVMGMGKSGHIGSKIAATLASTGSPAFFVHPGEASHGDLGMLTSQDVVLLLSYSGKTQELLTILPVIKRLDIPTISITGEPTSPLAEQATVHISVAVEEEACPLGLAPTASTTATLVMGDALAIALLASRGFTADDFARSHPGGALGQRLLLRVEDIMHSGDDIPTVSADAKVREALIEMTAKRLGMTTVVDGKGQLYGVFTDGDIRRFLDKDMDLKTAVIGDVINRGCKTIHGQMLAAEALRIMEAHKITSLVVVDNNKQLSGVLHMHDILKAGLEKS